MEEPPEVEVPEPEPYKPEDWTAFVTRTEPPSMFPWASLATGVSLLAMLPLTGQQILLVGVVLSVTGIVESWRIFSCLKWALSVTEVQARHRHSLSALETSSERFKASAEKALRLSEELSASAQKERAEAQRLWDESLLHRETAARSLTDAKALNERTNRFLDNPRLKQEP